MVSLSFVGVMAVCFIGVIIIRAAFPKERGGDKPFLSQRKAITTVLLSLFGLCLVYGVFGVFFGPVVDLQDSPAEDSAGLYSLLLTILLSLFATVITAYIFMIGALQGRKDYERPAILRLQSKATKYLISLSAITSLCVVSIFILASKNFNLRELVWVRYAVVFFSFADIVILLFYTYRIINYENEIRAVAREIFHGCFQKMKETGGAQAERKAGGKKLNEQFKTISDLEAIITQCQENHKAGNRFQDREMYNGVFDKIKRGNAAGIKEQYRNLILLKDAAQILREHGDDPAALPVPAGLLQRALDGICSCAKKDIMRGERFENLNFVKVNFSDGQFCNTSFRGAALIDVNLTGANLCGACFAGTVLRDVNFWDADCENADFTGALVETSGSAGSQSGKLSGAVFTNADLSGAAGVLNHTQGETLLPMENTMCSRTNFLGLKLTRVDFGGSVLTDAQLTKTAIRDCSFQNADMERALLIGASCTGRSNFGGANLSEVKAAEAEFRGGHDAALEFQNARLARANFASAKFQSCNFTGAYINDASFNDASFADCRFQGAIFHNTDLSRCRMQRCRLDYANLSQTLILANPDNPQTISRTVFSNVDFSGAALRGYTFEACDFTKAVFDGAVLRNVTFQRCVFRDSLFQNALLVDVFWVDCRSEIDEGAEDAVAFGTQDDQKRFRRFAYGR